MAKKILKNSSIMLVSVFLALIFWLYVNNEEDPMTSKNFSDIPVKIVNEEVFTKLGYSFTVTEGETIDITVSGRSSILSKLSSSDFYAYVDFKELSKVNAVPINIESEYEGQIEITPKGSGMMQIKAENIEETQIPVEIETRGTPENGYIYKENGKVTPNIITIKAPESIVEQAEKYIVTANISGASDSITVTTKPTLYDKEGNRIESNQVQTDTSEVEAKLPILKTQQVSILLWTKGKPKEGYELQSFAYSPDKIEIAGKENIVSQIKSIDLGEVDISGKDKTYEIDFPIKEEMLPDECVLANDKTTLKLQCKIKKKKKK